MSSVAIDFPDSIYHDTVSGMTLKKYCNKSFKPSLYDLSFDTQVSEGDVWFVKLDFLHEFFSVLPRDCPKISVVTHHSDYELNDDIMSVKPSCVKRIFGPNTTSKRLDVVPIPLGLGPPYCHLTPKSDDIKAINTRKERTRLLYVNFRVSTYPLERQTLMDRMLALKESLSGITVVSPPSSENANPHHIQEYMNSLVEHKFSVCPRGNGIDTHRLWECLYCRTIPIVRRMDAHRNFQDLPIFFVDNWDEVTEDRLNREYERIGSLSWNYSKLTASWWGKMFRE